VPPEETAAARSNAEVPTVSVLVIEPHPAIRHGITQSLQQLGYHPLGVATAGEAETAIGLATVTVVLIDHAIGNPNALTTLRTLERKVGGRPAVVMSSRAHVRDVVEAWRMGAADFLVKPFTTRELDAAVQRAVLQPVGPRVTRDDARGGPEPAYDMERDAVAMPDPVDLALADLSENNLDLPLRPPLLRELQAMGTKASYRVNEVVDLIGKDASLTGAVLTCANGGRFKTARPPSGLRQACLRLGTRNVYVAVLASSLSTAFDVDGNPWRNLGRKLLRQAIMAGNIAEALALRENLPDADEYNLAGLFHNVGELVLLRRIARYAGLSYAARPELSRVDRVLAEHHERAGEPMAASWELPPQVTVLCRTHHLDPDEAPASDLHRVVMGAWALTIDAGYSAFPEADPLEVAAHIRRLDLEPLVQRELVRDALRGLEGAGAMAA